MKLSSYLYGGWVEGDGDGTTLLDAAYGQPVAAISSAGLDLGGAARYARTVGSPGLQRLTFHDRARLLKALAQYLMERKEEFYALSYKTGATRRDGWVDIEGGIGTLFSYASMARRGLPNETFIVEDEPTPLSKAGGFVARHLLTPRRGVAVHLNAYNFPVWGMLEKLAPSLIAGVPSIVKPAPQTVYLAERVVRAMDESGLLPPGAVQLLVGEPGNLLETLDETDLVTFTGSAATGQRIKVHPNLIRHNIPFQMEADSLNATVLGKSVQPADPEFELFIKEVGNEITSKAGQKCTAIRRVMVPRGMEEAVIAALKTRLGKTTIGDPSLEAVRMGALVDRKQLERLRGNISDIAQAAEVVLDGSRGFDLIGGDLERGSFTAPTLFYCDQPLHATQPHEIEAFGPVATVMPYDSLEEAAELTRRGKGSLAGSVVTYDKAEARTLFFGMASAHGRVLILNRDNAKESTGHGSPMPQLVHGGPGRAGGSEELGGLRSVRHYMQRTAVQADPSTLAFLGNEWIRGAAVREDAVHPFRKYFEELQVGESLLTHRRTVTEADIVNFANVSGDYFYAHVDELAAKDSLFGKRVAHGYFLVSAAAGLFVWPGVGPVLANYGLENLRFIEPVGIGDTIQARLTVKKKTVKDPKPGEKATGVVDWDVQILNQEGKPVALYSIMTLVERLGV